MRKIDLYKDAEKFLSKIKYSDKKLYFNILQKIDQISRDPFPNTCKKLVGYDNLYRVRVDKYRII